MSDFELRAGTLHWVKGLLIRCRSVLAAGIAFLMVSTVVAQSTPDAETEPESRQQLIVVIGSPGAEEYSEVFATWASRWEEAAKRAEADCTVIGRSLDLLPAGSDSVTQQKAAPSDLERLRDAIAASSRGKATEPLWIVFVGHGTFDGRTASWNLNGPDITADQLAKDCSDVERSLAIVACCSCSAPFVNALSGPNRVIVTATKDGNQVQFCRFGDAMSLAVSTLDADINRDGQTSLLEAWLFASRRTADFYKSEGRLATEHSLLDDNGDAKGTRAEVFEGDRPAANVENVEQLDGNTAKRWHFVRSDEERRLTPEQRQTRDELETQIEELRARRDSLEESDFLQQLEALLLPLARLYEASETPPSAPAPDATGQP